MAQTPLEMYQAQADVLVPVMRQLTEKIGEQEARALMLRALGGHFRQMGKQIYSAAEGPNFGAKIHTIMDGFAAEEALDWELDEQTEDSVKFRVTGCRYAEIYKRLDAPDLGFLFICYQDYPLTEGIDGAAVLERPQTIMQGADHCIFHWYRHAEPQDVPLRRREEIERAGVEGQTGGA